MFDIQLVTCLEQFRQAGRVRVVVMMMMMRNLAIDVVT